MQERSTRALRSNSRNGAPGVEVNSFEASQSLHALRGFGETIGIRAIEMRPNVLLLGKNFEQEGGLLRTSAKPLGVDHLGIRALSSVAFAEHAHGWRSKVRHRGEETGRQG